MQPETACDLQASAPDREIGYSMLIYQVTPDQLHRALDRKLSDLITLIDEATAPSAR